MSVTVADIDVLEQYVKGVMERAKHHGTNVQAAVLALAGAVLWKKDEEPLEVYAREGQITNVLWFSAASGRYAFRYDHELKAIELRQGSLSGRVIHTFDNDTPLETVYSVFKAL